MISTNILKKTLSIAACGFFLAVIILLQNARLTRLNSQKDSRPQASIDTERRGLLLLKQLPSFGFNNLIASWTFLNFLQYYGDESAREQEGYALNPDFFEIIVNKDPRFIISYLFLSYSISIHSGKPDVSLALMKKGLKSLEPGKPPNYSYYLWRYKGIEEILFIGDIEAARQSFVTAAEWASLHPDRESQTVAAISQKTAEFLARDPDSRLAQAQAWASVYSQARDERTRKRIVRIIEDELGGTLEVTPQGAVVVTIPDFNK